MYCILDGTFVQLLFTVLVVVVVDDVKEIVIDKILI